MIQLMIAAGVAGALGIGGHLSAKETNEKAAETLERAQNMYNNAKSSLESAKCNAEESLLALGYAKKNALDGSIKYFLRSMERIRSSAELKDSLGMKEVSNFMIDEQGITELKKISDIYSSAISSSATGITTGVLIGMATSGVLPLVTESLSLAGSSLVAGELASAATFAGLAGAGLSMGVVFTPVSVIAAPVVLFTAISASAKADENLEKANGKMAEVKKVVEEMKVSETMCDAITKRSDMFRDLLTELNEIFSDFAKQFDNITEKKAHQIEGRKLCSKDFTKEEASVGRIANSLAEAVKAVINVPMLSKEGKLTIESQVTYDKVQADYNKKRESGIIQKQSRNSNIFCTGCGKKIVRDAKFCNYCGKKNTY